MRMWKCFATGNCAFYIEVLKEDSCTVLLLLQCINWYDITWMWPWRNTLIINGYIADVKLRLEPSLLRFLPFLRNSTNDQTINWTSRALQQLSKTKYKRQVNGNKSQKLQTFRKNYRIEMFIRHWLHYSQYYLFSKPNISIWIFARDSSFQSREILIIISRNWRNISFPYKQQYHGKRAKRSEAKRIVMKLRYLPKASNNLNEKSWRVWWRHDFVRYLWNFVFLLQSSSFSFHTQKNIFVSSGVKFWKV